jgi:hypothetical protein
MLAVARTESDALTNRGRISNIKGHTFYNKKLLCKENPVEGKPPGKAPGKPKKPTQKPKKPAKPGKPKKPKPPAKPKPKPKTPGYKDPGCKATDALVWRGCPRLDNKKCPALGQRNKGERQKFVCYVDGALVKANSKDKGTKYGFLYKLMQSLLVQLIIHSPL